MYPWYTHLHLCIFMINCSIIPEFLCMLLRSNYSLNYVGTLDTSLNEGYSSASFKLVVVPAVMSRQLTLFGKVVANRKVYMAKRQNYEQFVNAFVAVERRYSTSLPPEQAKLADAAWKAAIMGRTRWLGQMFYLPVRMMVSA